jgi:hypothetical protein
MDAIRGRSTACIEEKGFTTLISVENELKVSVRKDNASSKKSMWLLARHFLEPV